MLKEVVLDFLKEKVIKRINFGTCYRCLLLNAAVIIVSIILYPFKIGTHRLFHLAVTVLIQLLNLYASLGYVKYSYIKQEERFRKIISVAIVISIIQSLIITLDAVVVFYQAMYNILLGVTLLISTPVYFYAFGLIKNDDVNFFRKLARMNLYLLIIALVGLLLYLLELSSFLLLPTILGGFGTVVLLWYWQIRLFRHLSEKYC